MRSPKEEATVAEAVRHPLRARILEVLNERDMCPVDFVNHGYADFCFGPRPTVSHVAYHFRELAAVGFSMRSPGILDGLASLGLSISEEQGGGCSMSLAGRKRRPRWQMPSPASAGSSAMPKSG